MTRRLIRVAALLCLCTGAHAQSLQVLDYGAAPRAPLRYQFTAGQSERVAIEMDMSMTRQVNGQPVPVATVPPIRSTMNVHVTEVAADGSARVEFETLSSEARATQGGVPIDQAGLNRALATESLLKGSYRTDTRGRILDTGVSLPDGAMPAAASQMMNDLLGNQNETVQQLPEEAVGIGARWRVERRMTVAGATLVQAEEYTLRSRSGDRVELDVSMTQELSGAATPGPAVQAASSNAKASGKLVIDLHKLTPTMTMEVNGGTSVSPPGGQSQPAAMEIGVHMKMSLAPAAD